MKNEVKILLNIYQVNQPCQLAHLHSWVSLERNQGLVSTFNKGWLGECWVPGCKIPDKGVENRRNPWGPAMVFRGIIKGVIYVLKLLGFSHRQQGPPRIKRSNEEGIRIILIGLQALSISASFLNPGKNNSVSGLDGLLLKTRRVAAG